MRVVFSTRNQAIKPGAAGRNYDFIDGREKVLGRDATGDYGSSYTGTPTPSCRRRINGLYQLFHVGQRFFQLTR
jgi:hypothetical protein